MIAKEKNTFVFEKRPYTETSTLEEIEAIKQCVWIEENGFLWLKEIPVMTPFTINTMFDQIELLGQQFEEYVFLVDLRASDRPDAITRKTLYQRFNKISNISHTSFCTGKNFLINTAIRFVMFQTKIPSYSVSKTIEEALQSINEHR